MFIQTFPCWLNTPSITPHPPLQQLSPPLSCRKVSMSLIRRIWKLIGHTWKLKNLDYKSENTPCFWILLEASYLVNAGVQLLHSWLEFPSFKAKKNFPDVVVRKKPVRLLADEVCCIASKPSTMIATQCGWTKLDTFWSITTCCKKVCLASRGYVCNGTPWLFIHTRMVCNRYQDSIHINN